MRIAIIGTGKTGREVLHLLPKENRHAIFNSRNPVTLDALKGADCAIVFTPGSAVEEVSQILLEAQLPAVWGSTGFEWPSDIQARLKRAEICWVHGTNFSLGMFVMRQVLQQLGQLTGFLKNPQLRLVESHHKQKLDSPSGTALSWEKWLGQPVNITSIREGDIVGNHRLEIETENDSMVFEHKAKSRRIFAEGAIWVAQQITDGNFCSQGLHLFEHLAAHS